jgi:hypothetical protein
VHRGSVIEIGGLINPDDDKKFTEAARDVARATIVLNSMGGYNGAAMNIGTLIRSRNYETIVYNGAVCNSPCTLI